MPTCVIFNYLSITSLYNDPDYIFLELRAKQSIEQVTAVKVLILLPGSLSGPDSEVPDNGIKQIPETGASDQ